jgi:hypothetical protein
MHQADFRKVIVCAINIAMDRNRPIQHISFSYDEVFDKHDAAAVGERYMQTRLNDTARVAFRPANVRLADALFLSDRQAVGGTN